MKKFILPTLIISLMATPAVWAKGGHHDNKSQWTKVTKVKTMSHKVEHRLPQKHYKKAPVRHKKVVKHKVHHNNNVLTSVAIIAGVLHSLH